MFGRWESDFKRVKSSLFLSFSKHVFNILLKLITTLKKSFKLLFSAKRDTQISGFAVVKKTPNYWKKFVLLVCTDKIKESVRKFVQNKCVSRYLTFLMVLRFRKFVLHSKIINKTPTTKNQENPTYCFGESFLKKYLAKFLQDKNKLYTGGSSI